MVSTTSPSAEASSSNVSDNVASLREGILDESLAEQEELPALTDEEIKVCKFTVRSVLHVYMLI